MSSTRRCTLHRQLIFSTFPRASRFITTIMKEGIIWVAIIGALAQVTAQQNGCILPAESCTSDDTCCYADESGAMCDETASVCCLQNGVSCRTEADCCGGSLCIDGICGADFTYTAPAGSMEGGVEDRTVSIGLERTDYSRGPIHVSNVTGHTPDGEVLEVHINPNGEVASVMVDGERLNITDTRRLLKGISPATPGVQDASSVHRRLQVDDECTEIVETVCESIQNIFCLPGGILFNLGSMICNIIEDVLCTDTTEAVTECVTTMVRGDPHLVGFNGQKFSFKGNDGDWYALLHGETMNINMRVTLPDSMKSGVSFITGVGATLKGSDGELHQALITVDNPKDVNGERSCPEGATAPCLANGELVMMLDGEEIVTPGEYDLGGGVFLSAMNLPDECQHRAFRGMELPKEQSSDVNVSPGHRNLRIPFPAGQWILAITRLADTEECQEYVKLAASQNSFYDLQSRHASIQITTPYLSLRITHGKIIMKNKPYPSAPDQMAYRMDLTFEHVHLGTNPQGVLGTTTRVRKNRAHKDIIRGRGVIPGREDDYRVSEPLATGFDCVLE